jgi:hypothetical protein
MKPIRLITKTSDLEGTGYIEFLPGTYQNLHWNEGSVFLDEETFGYIEPIIERHVPYFDYFSFNEIPGYIWVKIVDDLIELKVILTNAQSINQFEGSIGLFMDNISKVCFTKNFLVNKSNLADIIEDLTIWILEKSSEHGSITILGL